MQNTLGYLLTKESKLRYFLSLQSTLGLFRKERITFRKPFRIMILNLSRFESLILPFVNTVISNQAFEMQKRGHFGS